MPRAPRLAAALAAAVPGACALIAAGGLVPAAARADAPIGTTDRPLTLSADAGALAWLRRDSDTRHRFVAVAARGAAPTVVGPVLTSPRPFDVARGRDGKPVIVWAEGCSTVTRRCTVRSQRVAGGPARTLTRIPYAGGGPPAVTQEGARIGYTVATFRVAFRQRLQCDVPYVRTLTGGARPARPRRLPRGECGSAEQLDLEGGLLAELAVILHPEDDTLITEARVLKPGGGGARTLQRESEGQESNYIDGIALDGGRLYTARGGFRQANAFTRLDPRTGARTDAQTFTVLVGGFARDGGRPYYVQNGTGGGDVECPSAAGTLCQVVAGQDPFAAGTRLLVPVLSLRTAPAIVYTDTPLVLSGTLVRRRVDRRRVVAEVPQPAVPVALSRSLLGPHGGSAFTPSGVGTATGPDGAWSVTIPAPAPPDTGYLAAAGARGALPATALSAAYPPVWVHVDVTSAVRDTAGDVTVTGTITPPQPGRQIRLDRRVRRTCHLPGADPGSTPSTVGTPKDCYDTFTTAAASTPVSADGATFTVTRHGPAGAYRAVLRSTAAPSYEGESAQVTVP